MRSDGAGSSNGDDDPMTRPRRSVPPSAYHGLPTPSYALVTKRSSAAPPIAGDRRGGYTNSDLNLRPVSWMIEILINSCRPHLGHAPGPSTGASANESFGWTGAVRS